MGLHFGNLGKVYGRVTHTYSPYELNPLKGIWTVKRLQNTARRFGDNLPFIVPRKSIQKIYRFKIKMMQHPARRKVMNKNRKFLFGYSFS